MEVEMSVVPTTSGVSVRLTMTDASTGISFVRTMTDVEFGMMADAVWQGIEHIAARLVELRIDAEEESMRVIDLHTQGGRLQ